MRVHKDRWDYGVSDTVSIDIPILMLLDTHIRVGGAIGSDLQTSDCPKLSGSVNPSCMAASLLFHMTLQSSGYFENSVVNPFCSLLSTFCHWLDRCSIFSSFSFIHISAETC